MKQAVLVGDWSAVGASAAFLLGGATIDSEAAYDQSTDVSFATTHEQENDNRDSSTGVPPSDSAAELDKLIQAGNWEAVMAAAARFESRADDTSSAISQSSDDDLSTSMATFDPDNDTLADTITTNATGGTTATMSTTVEHPARAQIAALLEKVAIHELGNVDDLLEEFQGREDDLIDMLKAMEQQQPSPTSVMKL